MARKRKVKSKKGLMHHIAAFKKERKGGKKARKGGRKKARK
jgi:hypothetical protein